MLWCTVNRCLKVQDLKKIIFDLFWPVFDLFTYNLTGFFPCQKNRGGTVWKIFFLPKSDSSHAKPDIKAKKSTHFPEKTLLKSRKCILAQVELFFKLFLPYTRQLEFISVKLLVLGIISWCSAQIRRDGGSGWAGWASAHPDFGRIEGASGQRRRAALLLLAYTRQIEFISVYSMVKLLVLGTDYGHPMKA